MSKNLVIVESPAKAKTIEKYLGKEFQVLASYGHVRDLIPKEGAVDTEHDFAMKYEIIERNQKHVQAITKAVKNAENLYLATDPDREGEAISWHLQELLNEKKLLKKKNVYRVVFHEITKKAVTEAIANPSELSLNLVNAQQARRALDYLVGFKLSPLLWKKIRRGLSAGRVQSPALRLIVERELEIEAFKPKEYWTIDGLLQHKQVFKAKLTYLNSEKVTQFKLNTADLAMNAKQTLLQSASGKVIVLKVEKKQRKSNPAPPFTTSTLQQEAARKLGFTTKRTMLVAQQLYEGIDIGGETAGLITYMRTDSVHLSVEAVSDIRTLIVENYGKQNLPKESREFKTKSKNAQEAHEAIRPTVARYLPSQIKSELTDEQFKLYELIWKRTIACQMIHATLNGVAIDFACGENNQHIFRATGSSIAEFGFMAVYLEGRDDDNETDDKENFLPAFEEGDIVDLNDVVIAQHFTEPPPRYGEASLVKSLEEFGIGRPSTYASIISTLQNRDYVTLENKRFYPTDVGRIVNKFLTAHFTQYVDYDFTAKLEDDLDAVSRGEKTWIPLMHEFWQPFIQLIQDKESSVQRKDVTQEEIDELCPECQSQLSIRLGRNGRFIGCTNYPECSYTRNLNEENNVEPEPLKDRACPKCESALVFKIGKYGKFIGCSAYPSCRYIEPLDKPENTGVSCPKCKKGSLFKRKAKNGKFFFSCENYPKCSFAIWHTPVNESCPSCNFPILILKQTKRYGIQKACTQKSCNYVILIDDAGL